MSDIYPLLREFNRCATTCSYTTVEKFYTCMFQLPTTSKSLHIFFADFLFEKIVSAACVQTLIQHSLYVHSHVDIWTPKLNTEHVQNGVKSEFLHNQNLTILCKQNACTAYNIYRTNACPGILNHNVNSNRIPFNSSCRQYTTVYLHPQIFQFYITPVL